MDQLVEDLPRPLAAPAAPQLVRPVGDQPPRRLPLGQSLRADAEIAQEPLDRLARVARNHRLRVAAMSSTPIVGLRRPVPHRRRPSPPPGFYGATVHGRGRAREARTRHDQRRCRPEPPPSEERLLNRELSWLEFNARVLDLAADESQPLLERVKFCSIFSSNLDEFFMVRVAGLIGQEAAGFAVRSADGLTPDAGARARSGARDGADGAPGEALEARAAARARRRGHRDRDDRRVHAEGAEPARDASSSATSTRC